MTGGPDFFLGERAEYRVTDFDGRVRACYVTAGLRLLTPDAGGFQPHYLRVQVAPPFPLGESGWAEELVVSERHVGDDLTRLGDGFIFVRLYEILDSDGLSRGVIEDGAVRLQSWGQVARSPTLLPPSREERFERSFGALERFVGREGHADVPAGWVEGDVPLGTWVGNIRHYQELGELRQEWVSRLQSLPGWRWSGSSAGSGQSTA